MALHAQKKGKRGEKQFCEWIYKHLEIKTDRNYNQADGHSADVIIDDFIFEVKRQESLSLDDWWWQVAIAKKNHENKDLIPVVAFRQNRKPWQFLIPAKLIGIELGYMLVSEKIFIELAKKVVGVSNVIRL